MFVLLLADANASSLRQPVSDMDAGKGVSIYVESAFDRLPNCGFAPLRLVIRNDSPVRHSWDFSFSSSPSYDERQAFRSGVSVDCDAKAERIVEIMVPLASESGAYSYPRLTTRVSGHGCGGNSMQVWSAVYSATSGRGGTAFIALSESLGVTAWSPLDTKLKAEGVDFMGTQFEPAKAPGDWRGWLGCDSVWLSAADWDSFDGVHRQALLDWLKLGGKLHVCFPGGDINSALPDLPRGDDSVGLGRFYRDTAKDNAKFVDHVASTIRADQKLVETIRSGYSSGWPLRSGIPAVVVHSGLILLFVGIFAVLIGPVNLFALARRKKHMHLFWTTPALSILASIALAAVIILQDGFGGRGFRFNAVYLDSAAHKACIVQEQISRSGVLLARRVPVREPFFITPVNADAGFENRSRSYSLETDALTGDWFSSRTVDGHLLMAVQPSRARIEISAAGDAPAVTSGIGTTLTDIFYRDIRQNIWRVQNLKTGERKKMQPATEAALREFWRKQTVAAGGYLNPRLAAVQNQDNFFFASDSVASDQVIPTLPAINWTQNAVIYFGPVATTGAAP